MKIVKNPDLAKYEAVTMAVEQNGGYCPCVLIRTDDTKCLCREFRQQETEGECHCGRFFKVKEESE